MSLASPTSPPPPPTAGWGWDGDDGTTGTTMTVTTTGERVGCYLRVAPPRSCDFGAARRRRGGEMRLSASGGETRRGHRWYLLSPPGGTAHRCASGAPGGGDYARQPTSFDYSRWGRAASSAARRGGMRLRSRLPPLRRIGYSLAAIHPLTGSRLRPDQRALARVPSVGKLKAQSSSIQRPVVGLSCACAGWCIVFDRRCVPGVAFGLRGHLYCTVPRR